MISFPTRVLIVCALAFSPGTAWSQSRAWHSLWNRPTAVSSVHKGSEAMTSPGAGLLLLLLASPVPKEVDRGVPVALKIVLVSPEACRPSAGRHIDLVIDRHIDFGDWREATTGAMLPLVADTSSRPSGANRVTRSVLIGAAVGGGVGAVAGAIHCRADCGGGRARGVAVFTPIGAAVGAGIGYLVAVVGAHAP